MERDRTIKNVNYVDKTIMKMHPHKLGRQSWIACHSFPNDFLHNVLSQGTTILVKMFSQPPPWKTPRSDPKTTVEIKKELKLVFTSLFVSPFSPLPC